MTAVKYDESKDFPDGKVSIQVLQGKLRNNVHLSHLYCRHASLARVSMKMWRFLYGHAAINGANCTLWSSFPCKTQSVFLRNRDFLGELLAVVMLNRGLWPWYSSCTFTGGGSQ